MKKIILLVAVSISMCVTSCKSDDDAAGPVEMQDPFVGTWKIAQEFENGVELMQETCDLEETIVVKNDGTYSGTYYLMGASDCEVGGTYTGSWENLGNNKYKITSNGEETISIEATITFSGNTMTTITNDEDGELRQILTRV